MDSATRSRTSRRQKPADLLSPALIGFLTEQGYRELQLVGAVVCGLHRFNFTTGLVVGLTMESYERRYCYEHAHDALAAMRAWDGDGHPSGPWIKCKGAGFELLNPTLSV